jgi:hypothetical protein
MKSVKNEHASKILGVLAMSSCLGKVMVRGQVAQHRVQPTWGTRRVIWTFVWL